MPDFDIRIVGKDLTTDAIRNIRRGLESMERNFNDAFEAMGTKASVTVRDIGRNAQRTTREMNDMADAADRVRREIVDLDQAERRRARASRGGVIGGGGVAGGYYGGGGFVQGLGIGRLLGGGGGFGALGGLGAVGLGGGGIGAAALFANQQLLQSASFATERLGQVQATGLSSEDYQRYSFAARQVGFSANAFADAAFNLQEDISQALQGDERSLELFKAIGVEVREIARLDTGQQLRAINTGFKNVGNELERNAIAMALFGEEGGKAFLAIGDVDEATKGLRVTSDEATKSLSGTNRALATLGNNVRTTFEDTFFRPQAPLGTSGTIPPAPGRTRPPIRPTVVGGAAVIGVPTIDPEDQAIIDEARQRIDSFYNRVRAGTNEASDAVIDFRNSLFLLREEFESFDFASIAQQWFDASAISVGFTGFSLPTPERTRNQLLAEEARLENEERIRDQLINRYDTTAQAPIQVEDSPAQQEITRQRDERLLARFRTGGRSQPTRTVNVIYNAAGSIICEQDLADTTVRTINEAIDRSDLALQRECQ